MNIETNIASGSPRRWRSAAVGIGVLLLGATACSSATHAATGGGGAGGSGGSAMTVSVAKAGSVGRVLVDSSGATLYVNNRDTATHQACTAACQVFWQPLTVSGHGMPTASGAVTGALGVRQTSAGRQVTYRGKLLYTFTQDHSAGQANGNNFTDSFNGVQFTWLAATPSGTAAAGSSPSQGGGGGYGSSGSGGGYGGGGY